SEDLRLDLRERLFFDFLLYGKEKQEDKLKRVQQQEERLPCVDMGLLKLGIYLGYGCFVCHCLRDTVRIQRDRNISLGWFKLCFVLRKDLGIDAT
ncbi:hypothetical protein S245_051540, partial [Arachis hypogaea]